MPAAWAENRTAPVQGDYGQYFPRLVTRAMWQAKPALAGMIPQQPTSIVLHHTGVRRNPGVSLEPKLRNLQSFSQRPVHRAAGRNDASWPDVPYHFYLDASGRIAEGRDVRFAGDTNTGYDTRGHIQVAIEGDFDTEEPTLQQLEALRDLLAWLMLSWNLTAERISVHKEHAPTDCPGRKFLAALPSVMAQTVDRHAAAIADLCRSGSSADFTKVYYRNR
ncbi:MAG TPA: peptidoglycan recognition family protein [Xanthobacteraceae bacterium]|nr:peptidoglycan recognition family protein [Xanthobacteraceae bacterium]